MLYILELLVRIPANKKDIITQDGFIPIKARYLQNKVADYLPYMEYLVDTGILESDNHYVEGSKSIGYRYAPKYFEEEMELFTTEVKTPRFRVRKDSEAVEKAKYSSDELFKRKHLTHWFNTGELRIDDQSALSYAKELRDKKLNGEME